MIRADADGQLRVVGSEGPRLKPPADLDFGRPGTSPDAPPVTFSTADSNQAAHTSENKETVFMGSTWCKRSPREDFDDANQAPVQADISHLGSARLCSERRLLLCYSGAVWNSSCRYLNLKHGPYGGAIFVCEKGTLEAPGSSRNPGRQEPPVQLVPRLEPRNKDINSDRVKYNITPSPTRLWQGDQSAFGSQIY